MTMILVLMAIMTADLPVSVVDLEGYRQAIAVDPGSPSTPATFRDLWDKPDAFVGRRVRVEGRIARVFRQPGVGEFPAMAEAWIVTASGDPTCLVFPQKDAKVEVGADVAFAGTYLRRIRYRGGDVYRLAPLIVGPEAPLVSRSPDVSILPGLPTDWLVGLVLASFFVLMLTRRHFSRPIVRPRSLDPAPRFVDSHPDPTENGATDGEAR